MAKSAKTSRVFVSYSRRDTDEVLSLVQRLERETGERFWIDREGIESGSQFEEDIIAAIDRAEVVLFMTSEDAQLSEWTKKEIGYAMRTHKRVVPIIINGGELRGWFLFNFGLVNYVDASKDEQLQRLGEDVRKWLGTSGEPLSPPPVPERDIVPDKRVPAAVPRKTTARKNLINGHECVDLGLSVKWATCNVGADAPRSTAITSPGERRNPKTATTRTTARPWA